LPRIPDLCRCGHPPDIHEHLRDGSDCGLCGRDTCPDYSPPRGWRRYLRRLEAAETQNELLWAEVLRLRAESHALRNAIALGRYTERGD
jgi:hypothetical protein